MNQASLYTTGLKILNPVLNFVDWMIHENGD